MNLSKSLLGAVGGAALTVVFAQQAEAQTYFYTPGVSGNVQGFTNPGISAPSYDGYRFTDNPYNKYDSQRGIAPDTSSGQSGRFVGGATTDSRIGAYNSVAGIDRYGRPVYLPETVRRGTNQPAQGGLYDYRTGRSVNQNPVVTPGVPMGTRYPNTEAFIPRGVPQQQLMGRGVQDRTAGQTWAMTRGQGTMQMPLGQPGQFGGQRSHGGGGVFMRHH